MSPLFWRRFLRLADHCGPDCFACLAQITLEAGSTKYICMCGQSNRYPICDGHHNEYNEENGTDIEPQAVTNDTGAAKEFRICGCGHSKSRPFCDGTHRSLHPVLTDGAKL